MPLWLKIILTFLVLFTVASMLDKKAWWIRVFDFPRSQIAVLLVVFLIISLYFSVAFSWFDLLLVVSGVLAFTYQSIYIFPYLPIAPKEVVTFNEEDMSRKLSIMVSNVRMKNRDSQRLLKLVKERHPDIFLTVENNQWWDDELKELELLYPYRVNHPLENTYGMTLYSKIEFKKAKVKFLVQEDIPSIHTEIMRGSTRISMISIHPRPPAPEQASSSRPRDRELLKVADKIYSDDEPYVVFGDFNDVAWSDTSAKFQKRSKMLDPRKGRGFFNTFNANIPVFRFPLDHFFFTKHFKFIKLTRLRSVGSDHFPIMIEITVD